jgi:sulfate adenylyltransferase subunit 1
VCRPQASSDPALHDYRGFMGRVESGSVTVGDEVEVLPSGRQSRVKDVQLGGVSIGRAVADQSVAILLEDELDVSRGDLVVRAGDAPLAARQIDAMVCWLSESPLDRSRKYVVRHTSREVRAAVAAIDHRVDVNTLERAPAERLQMNDIAQVRFKLAQPIFADRYADHRTTGAFIVVDESTNDTVGAGMIL